MIEVEKKFLLKEEEIARLTAGAELVGTKKFTDVYYDTPDFMLTKEDIWLRERAGRFELKYPYDGRGRKGMITQYEEYEDEESIRKKIGLPVGGPFKNIIRDNGYVPFATITTTRTKYKNDGLSIDSDIADFGYGVIEVECMVEKKEDVDAALQRILKFAAERGIIPSTERIRGKVVEYLHRYDLAHLRALEAAWGVKL